MTETPTSSPLPAAAKPKSHKLLYAGTQSDLFRIFLVNLLLTILSLGTYYPWARTRMRKYLWSSLYFVGSPFEYTGRGKEVFFGFLQAAGWGFAWLIAIGIIGIYLPSARAIGLLLGAIIFIPIVPFMARRYRLGRSSWRKIKCEQVADTVLYGQMAIPGLLLNILTLGYYVPYNSYRLISSQINQVCFGNRAFRYRGTKQDLCRAYRKGWLIWIAGLLAGIGLFAATLPVGAAGDSIRSLWGLSTSGAEAKYLGRMTAGQEFFFGTLAGGAVCACGLWIAILCAGFSVWHKTKLARHIARNTQFDGMEFRFDVTFRQMLELKAGNAFIRIASLGLLTPIAINRTMRFIERNLKMRGMPHFAKIRQGAWQDHSTLPPDGKISFGSSLGVP